MQMTAPLRVSLLACGASAVALGLSALGGFGAGGMVERSVADAIDRSEAFGSGAAAVAHGPDPSHIHLSRLPMGQSLGTSVAVGDRMTLARREGGAAAFEIIEIRPLSSNALGTASASGPGLMLITAVTAAGQMPSQTIRFIFEGDNRNAPAPPAKPHAL